VTHPDPAAHVEETAPVDSRVQAAVDRSAELADTTPDEHVAIYESVHRTLQEVLADAAGPEGTGESPGTGGEGDAER
jgi:hypothetical protein